MCWHQDKEEELPERCRTACLALLKAATNATEAVAAPGVVVPSTPGVPVDPPRIRRRLENPFDPRTSQALADEIREHRALAVVPDTPLGHPPSQPAVVPLRVRPRLGMLLRPFMILDPRCLSLLATEPHRWQRLCWD